MPVVGSEEGVWRVLLYFVYTLYCTSTKYNYYTYSSIKNSMRIKRALNFNNIRIDKARRIIRFLIYVHTYTVHRLSAELKVPIN